MTSMLFFLVQQIQIASREPVSGDEWSDILDQFLTGLEREEPDIMERPRLLLTGTNRQTVMIRYEPRCNGFWAMGSDGETREELATLDEALRSSGYARDKVFQALRQFSDRPARPVRLDLNQTASLSLIERDGRLWTGHAGLPANMAVYGNVVNGLRPEPVHA